MKHVVLANEQFKQNNVSTETENQSKQAHVYKVIQTNVNQKLDSNVKHIVRLRDSPKLNVSNETVKQNQLRLPQLYKVIKPKITPNVKQNGPKQNVSNETTLQYIPTNKHNTKTNPAKHLNIPSVNLKYGSNVKQVSNSIKIIAPKRQTSPQEIKLRLPSANSQIITNPTVQANQIFPLIKT